jgi:hypothetical protein
VDVGGTANGSGAAALARGRLGSRRSGVLAVVAVGCLLSVGLGPAYAAKAPAPIVTPDQARTIATGLLAADTSTTREVSKVYAGPAFAMVNASLLANEAAGQPQINAVASGVQVFVPRQSSYPAQFLVVSDLAQYSESKIALVERPSRGASWKIIASTASASRPSPANLPTPDSSGYVPTGSLKGLAFPADRMAKFICPFLQNPSDNSTPITDAGGNLTANAQNEAQNSQNAAASGIQHQLTCSSTQRSVPLISLAVGSATLIETTLRYTVTLTAGAGSSFTVDSGNPATAPPPGVVRDNFVKPGNYRTVTNNVLLVAFVVVPTTGSQSGGLTVISLGYVPTTSTGVLSRSAPGTTQPPQPVQPGEPTTAPR